ncbi:MAG TPA: helix-turn-helix transcriptional regulator [Caulobacteraceae bacterium]|nr:helix-turn-helix transcriptional regulator [Caulobacteraceae bacterium]
MSFADGYLIAGSVDYPDGHRLARHDHEWGQLTFCNSGVMRVASDSAVWLSPPTRAIWLPAGAPHEIVMKGEVAARFLYLAPQLALPLPREPRLMEVAPLLRELILHILSVGALHPEAPAEARLAGLVVDLLLAARPIDLALPLPKDRRARTLTARLLASPADPAPLTDLARHAGASLRTLQRVFPAETGLTLEAWRQKARLIAGAAALAGGAPVTAAALDCGYESPSAFITAFKRQFGMTPGRFRM